VGIAGGGPEVRLGKGHESCSGRACHAVSAKGGGSAPPLEACEGCHVPGLLPDRDADQTRRAWSVAARFRHATHATDRRAPKGTPLPCEACHAEAARAATVREIAPPPKRRCAPCHEGRIAFKMTGHGCARCHGR
jgi:c(7)-type cytochrome triheme protein